MNGMTYDLFVIALLLAVTVLMPVIGVRDYRSLLRQLREGRPNARLKTYLWTIAVMWPLTLGMLAWWLLADGKLETIGLVPVAGGWHWLGIGAGVVVVVIALIQMRTVLRNPEQLNEVYRQSGELCEIAPRSQAERRVFVLVCITAGVCEEILYRGLLTAVLSAALGTWPAVVLATLIFGLGHAYQGLKGIGKTAAAGLVMALLALGSGSLFIPMLVHTVIDLTSGRLLGTASRKHNRDTAAEALQGS